MLVRNKILYSEHKIGEEAIYSFLVLMNANSFSFINESVYDYVNREGSQSDLPMDDPWGSVALALKEKITTMNLYQEYANTINAFIITAAVVSLDKMALKYKYSCYRKNAQKKICEYRQNIDLQYSVDFKSMDKKALIVYPLVKIGWVTPLYLISRLRRVCRKK